MSTALDAGIAGSRYLRLLLKQSEVKADDALGKLFHLLAEMGYFVKRGDRYRRTNKIPPVPPSRLLGAVFDDVIIPYLLGEAVKPNHEALFAATALFQPYRARAASKFGKGSLALVAGWLPCGFSTEISAATGADLVIVDENWEVLALEEERVSILPLELERVEEPLAASVFLSFEACRLEDLPLDKYGKFSFAVICHRGVDIKKVKELAERVYRVNFGGSLGIFADLISESLGLGRGEECGRGGKIVYKDSEVCVTEV
ncbi:MULTISPECIES: hypothetical protein [Pyrobaculum]|uniref:Uncharacterized protein n=3 Tax=Pyrobaculum TaxID=2276 RepID=A4WMC9_PYRAR|nr:hypothetical protein [Pyrobaculum arsenaticum]ABP51546.1 conserved hypothetical protein [Pyrobaculum arsenaticum DSM 13514]MCY0891024.1 hypothetical protein [Pyrobaculum arsenaticum]NYR16485.1 hypothetical protein [Pyrobaculum arsenaticum]